MMYRPAHTRTEGTDARSVEIERHDPDSHRGVYMAGLVGFALMGFTVGVAAGVLIVRGF